MRILVTGGTVFVSKSIALYFVSRGDEVHVLNRGTKEQVKGCIPIIADRSCLGDILKNTHFDAVIDVCAYKHDDVKNLLNALGEFDDYILISSSAVYPETLSQPFKETQPVGENSIWGAYGTNKILAENYLLNKCPNAYILRPPYLYGPWENVYREPFVFECAEKHRKFYIPNDGKMKLQFFHTTDLCKVIETITTAHPANHIFNVGNKQLTDINTFVELCYKAVGVNLEKVYITNHPNQRDYFSFYDYEYSLDVTLMENLLPVQIPLEQGLIECYENYENNKSNVIVKPFIDFIDRNFNWITDK